MRILAPSQNANLKIGAATVRLKLFCAVSLNAYFRFFVNVNNQNANRSFKPEREFEYSKEYAVRLKLFLIGQRERTVIAWKSSNQNANISLKQEREFEYLKKAVGLKLFF